MNMLPGSAAKMIQDSQVASEITGSFFSVLNLVVALILASQVSTASRFERFPRSLRRDRRCLSEELCVYLCPFSAVG